MKKKKLLWSALLLLVLGACDTAVQQVADNGKQTVVQFTSVVEGELREVHGLPTIELECL